MAQARKRCVLVCFFVDAGFGGLVSPFLLGFRSDPLFVFNGPFSLRLGKTDSWVESIGSTDHSIPMLIGKTHGFSHVTFQPNIPMIFQLYHKFTIYYNIYIYIRTYIHTYIHSLKHGSTSRGRQDHWQPCSELSLAACCQREALRVNDGAGRCRCAQALHWWVSGEVWPISSHHKWEECV